VTERRPGSPEERARACPQAEAAAQRATAEVMQLALRAEEAQEASSAARLDAEEPAPPLQQHQGEAFQLVVAAVQQQEDAAPPALEEHEGAGLC